MKKRSESDQQITPRLLDIDGLQKYLSLGKNSADQLARAAGARIKVGKRVLYDRKMLDSHINILG